MPHSRARPAIAAAALLLMGAGPVPVAPANPSPGSAPLPAPPAGPDKTVSVFGDWEARCDLRAGAAQSCELVQGVVDREHRPILVLAVKPPTPPGGAPVLLAQLPVNVLIAGDVQITLDPASPPVALKLQLCVASGCYASVELAPALRERLAGWGDKPAMFSFVTATQARAQVPISWRGFGQALTTIAVK